MGFAIWTMWDSGKNIRTCMQQAYTVHTGIDFKVKPVVFNDTRVKLQIWDTAGQERFHTLSTSYFRGAQGFVLVYDITNLKSFQSITIWISDIYEKAGEEVDVILLGNKCDKESERVVPKQKGEKLAWEYGMPFFETSAKENVNIEHAFSVLTKEILEKWTICPRLMRCLSGSTSLLSQSHKRKELPRTVYYGHAFGKCMKLTQRNPVYYMT
uniref:small monomeric GTPase n=1 Tax=Ficedula albicollis TaxID=59894 RepID=A0A803VNU1_FICAL